MGYPSGVQRNSVRAFDGPRFDLNRRARARFPSKTGRRVPDVLGSLPRRPSAIAGWSGTLKLCLPTSPRPASSPATPTTSKPASPPTAATAIRCNPDRYRLIVARACPWANRAIIVRRLLGLESVLSIGFCGPTHDKRSWTFDLDPGGVDPVLKIPRLQDAFFKRFPDYPKGITVPAIVDVPTGAVVTNDFAQMTLDLSTEWTAYHRDGAPQLYPERLRDRDRRGRASVSTPRSTTAFIEVPNSRAHRTPSRSGSRPLVHHLGLGE